MHGLGLDATVCGTVTTLLLCERAAANRIGIYLYGSTPATLLKLQARLRALFPALLIAGAESPPFGALGAGEVDAAIERINGSGAGFVFIGLGSPKQEKFAWEHRTRIQAVQLCVGAAFDFIAGTKTRAPRWMQRAGLEWLHRMCSEPTRLGRRYVLGNARFLSLIVPELIRAWTRPMRPDGARR
jgi:N-acetylglucosaminyldiphosphoundecaprenol N-acetyl-beta-D-mannosaminyltransferase